MQLTVEGSHLMRSVWPSELLEATSTSKARGETVDKLDLEGIIERHRIERRTAWGGRDSIDHGPGGHDDVANAVAGALVAAQGPSEPAMLTYMRLVHERRLQGLDPWKWD